MAASFGIGPHAAHVELGGRPLRPRERRRLTLDVMDANRFAEMLRGNKATGGDKAEAEKWAAQYTQADHRFFKEVCQSGDGGRA